MCNDGARITNRCTESKNTRMICGYQTVRKVSDRFRRLDTTPAYDGRTDGQTDTARLQQRPRYAERRAGNEIRASGILYLLSSAVTSWSLFDPPQCNNVSSSVTFLPYAALLISKQVILIIPDKHTWMQLNEQRKRQHRHVNIIIRCAKQCLNIKRHFMHIRGKSLSLRLLHCRVEASTDI